MVQELYSMKIGFLPINHSSKYSILFKIAIVTLLCTKLVMIHSISSLQARDHFPLNIHLPSTNIVQVFITFTVQTRNPTTPFLIQAKYPTSLGVIKVVL